MLYDMHINLKLPYATSTLLEKSSLAERMTNCWLGVMVTEKANAYDCIKKRLDTTASPHKLLLTARQTSLTKQFKLPLHLSSARVSPSQIFLFLSLFTYPYPTIFAGFQVIQRPSSCQPDPISYVRIYPPDEPITPPNDSTQKCAQARN